MKTTPDMVLPALPVFATIAAPPALAGWLQRLLLPVATDCKFVKPVPVEVRPTGRFSGWVETRDGALDRRVALSNRLSFWTAERVISLYIHECSHRLLDQSNVSAHGAEFLCLNLILLVRSASFFKADPVDQIDLYDFQDCPEGLVDEPAWRGLVLDWALVTAAELASTEMTAEALAPIVCQRWGAYMTVRHEAAAKAARIQRLARQQEIELIEILRSRSLARWLAAVGWFSFIAVSYFILKRGIT